MPKTLFGMVRDLYYMDISICNMIGTKTFRPTFFCSTQPCLFFAFLFFETQPTNLLDVVAMRMTAQRMVVKKPRRTRISFWQRTKVASLHRPPPRPMSMIVLVLSHIFMKSVPWPIGACFWRTRTKPLWFRENREQARQKRSRLY